MMEKGHGDAGPSALANGCMARGCLLDLATHYEEESGLSIRRRYVLSGRPFASARSGRTGRADRGRSLRIVGRRARRRCRRAEPDRLAPGSTQPSWSS